MQDPAFNQTDFRGRYDDGGEAGATWKETINTDWTQYFGDAFRVRFVIAEENGVAVNNTEWRLQYDHNNTGWNNVDTTSSVVQAVTSTYFADGDATTQQLGTGTFLPGEMSEDGLAGEVNGTMDFDGNDESEVEYAIDIVDADVADGDTIQFRVIRGDGTVISYTNTPTVTVSSTQIATPAPASVTSSAVNPSIAWDQFITAAVSSVTSSANSVSSFISVFVDLAWQDNADNEDGFNIYRTSISNPVFPDDYTRIDRVGVNITSYTDRAPEGPEYTYALTSYNTFGESSETTATVYTGDTTSVGGTCTLNGSGVPAKIYIVDTTNDSVVKELTANSDGTWSVSIPSGLTVHVAAQYDDGTDKWNDYSKPYLNT